MIRSNFCAYRALRIAAGLVPFDAETFQRESVTQRLPHDLVVLHQANTRLGKFTHDRWSSCKGS